MISNLEKMLSFLQQLDIIFNTIILTQNEIDKGKNSIDSIKKILKNLKKLFDLPNSAIRENNTVHIFRKEISLYLGSLIEQFNIIYALLIIAVKRYAAYENIENYG